MFDSGYGIEVSNKGKGKNLMGLLTGLRGEIRFESLPRHIRLLSLFRG